MAKNYKNIGEVSEAQLLAKCIKLGWVVLKPFGGNQRYDYVIDRGKGFERVQVKTARIKEGCVRFYPCSASEHKRKNYKGQADLFIVYCPENDAFYILSVEDVGITEVNLRLDPVANNQVKRIRFAKDYELK